MKLEKVISGGQTGVDRGALDAALLAGIPVGGCCTKGRKAEDGPIPDRYPLTELSSDNYRVRTEQNVKDADATLVLTVGTLTGGTALTIQLARRHGKPYLVEALDGEPDPVALVKWLVAHEVKVLNVAGPRESRRPGFVHKQTVVVLRLVFGASG
jgi:predicted Rossmann-fold nucleotide-binding protein